MVTPVQYVASSAMFNNYSSRHLLDVKLSVKSLQNDIVKGTIGTKDDLLNA